MNRIEFMSRLVALLQDVSVVERQEAMQYYNDYFDDAGAENELHVIKELGSPEKVAATIKSGLSGRDDESSEYGEKGYTDTRFEKKDSPARTGTGTYQEDSGYTKKSGMSAGKIVAIILLICIGIPIALPVGIGLLAAVFGIIVAIAAVCIGVVVAAVIMVIVGLVLVIVGISQMFVNGAVGVGLCGVGCILLAVGAVACVLIFKLSIIIIPAIVRGIVNICRKPFHRKAA